MKSNLIFIGMPAVGKSTVGIVVAKRLGMKFYRYGSADSGAGEKTAAGNHCGSWTRWFPEN